MAGFRAWLKLGYCVSRGERAIRIWVPIPPSRQQIAEWEHAGSDGDPRPRTRFKLGPVFDRGQVSPLPPPAEPAKLDPPLREVTGTELAPVLPLLMGLAGEVGSVVEFEAIGGQRHGYYEIESRRIAIRDDMPANAQAKTLIHELAHALLRAEPASEDPELGRAEEELVVESVIFSSCQVEQLGAAGFRFGNSCHRRRSSGVRFARTRPVLSSRSRTTREVGSSCLSARCGSGRLIVAPCGCVFDGAGSHRAGPES